MDHIKFFIQLGKLFDRAEQESDIENEKHIYEVARLYLEENNLSLNELKNIVENNDVQQKYKDIDNTTLLLTYMTWKENVKK